MSSKDQTPESAVFEAQAIIQGLATGTGLSGLAIRGKVSTRAGMASAKLTGKSIRYNVWEWDPRFRRPTG